MIEVKNLCKSYHAEQPVLRDISFKVEAGEFVVVLGPSGAGKSTLLRCINHLTLPSGGAILINGEDCSGKNRRAQRQLRQRVAMVFQHHNLIERLSVIKNVLTGRMARVPFWACLLQLFPSADVEACRLAIKQVGLEEKTLARADSLSGGQKQRVGIARALAQEPELILADEPVASLDPKSSRETLSYLREVSQKRNIAVLCNLHQIDYAMEYATRIIGLSDGKLVFDDLPQNLTPEVIEAIYPGLRDDNVSKLVLRMSKAINNKNEAEAENSARSGGLYA
ncbi:phosphonate transport system ATP-binding protein [Sinobacterium caligoides]|uniref:Phosphonate transport system ATP-binding protein n=1 Tax=Sinobacterium caligoides TaxID=933926 RepID=A0A3N2DQF8_9GAMM|nr:phosphonate ABC transporter ATP-binding protein [Sinobacterium caligoides]ROS02066.1 phosphonate transport system ATP-binding protein [Sinobacterium caligoides]